MIRVARGGLQTTIQDVGRRGVQQHGVARGGAMDTAAHRVVNLLVGNGADAATLECTMIGPVLELESDALLALGGADLGATLNDRTAPLWRSFTAPAGSVLAMSGARSGCRAYIAVAGGIDVPAVMGSRATDLIGGIGGFEGRALRSGDALALLPAGAASEHMRARLAAEPDSARTVGRSVLPRYTREPVIRIVRGPEHDRFSRASRDRLLDSPFEVTPQSNRMGIRLVGAPLSLTGPYDLVSSPVTAGTIQVPPSGEAIVLMADHQTIGGYPRIASVVTVDIPLLAQAAPGTQVHFREVSIAEAQALYLDRDRDFRLFAESLRIHFA